LTSPVADEHCRWLLHWGYSNQCLHLLAKESSVLEHSQWLSHFSLLVKMANENTNNNLHQLMQTLMQNPFVKSITPHCSQTHQYFIYFSLLSLSLTFFVLPLSRISLYLTEGNEGSRVGWVPENFILSWLGSCKFCEIAVIYGSFHCFGKIFFPLVIHPLFRNCNFSLFRNCNILFFCLKNDRLENEKNIVRKYNSWKETKKY
jgi:hypothetical protein